MREILGKTVRDTLEELLDPHSCAVLAIDIQNDAMRVSGAIARSGKNIDAMVDVLPRCAALLAEARAAGVRVIHIQVTDLPFGLSDSPAWLRAKHSIAGVASFFVSGTWGADICDECAPEGDELVITKHRASAFQGTELDLVLRSNGVETVVLIGEQTPGCVDATLRDATYHDYYAVLVEDCVAAFDPVLHEAALTIQRARHDVHTLSEVAGIWRAARSSQLDRATVGQV